MPSGLAFLAGLGQGATTLGNSLEQRRMLEEQQRRQAAQDALNRLMTMRGMGAVEDTGTPTAGDFEGTLQPGSLASGGGALSALVEAAQKAQGAERFALPDAQGNITQFRIDESRTPEARAMRSLMARESAAAQRLEAGKEADYKRQLDLETLRQSGRPGNFGAVTVGNTVFVLDRETGKKGDELGQIPEKELTPGQASLQASREQRNEQSLAKQYEANPLVKNAYGVANAIAPARVALSENTPLGDLMALYAIVKLYDPESVVREGEIKLAQSANSLPQRVRLAYENTLRGRKITPEYRQQIVQMVDAIQAEKEGQIAPVQKRFGQRSRQYGADSSFVAPSPFEGLKSGTANRTDKYRTP